MFHFNYSYVSLTNPCFPRIRFTAMGPFTLSTRKCMYFTIMFVHEEQKSTCRLNIRNFKLKCILAIALRMFTCKKDISVEPPTPRGREHIPLLRIMLSRLVRKSLLKNISYKGFSPSIISDLIEYNRERSSLVLRNFYRPLCRVSRRKKENGAAA